MKCSHGGGCIAPSVDYTGTDADDDDDDDDE